MKKKNTKTYSDILKTSKNDVLPMHVSNNTISEMEIMERSSHDDGKMFPNINFDVMTTELKKHTLNEIYNETIKKYLLILKLTNIFQS